LGARGYSAEANLAVLEVLEQLLSGTRTAPLSEAEANVVLGAADAIKRIGEPAYDVLLTKIGDREIRSFAADFIRDHSYEWKAAPLSVLGRQILIDAALSDDADLRQFGVRSLGAVVVTDERVKQSLLDGLRNSGKTERFVAAVIDVFDNQRDYNAIYLFDALGARARKAIPALVRAHLTQQSYDREHYQPALRSLGAEPATLVPLIAEGLAHGKAYSRHVAVEWLADIGPESLPVMICAFKDLGQTRELRTQIAGALGNMGPAARDALPALRDALRDPDPNLRSVAADAIWRIQQRPVN
jgi:hypothetical protein